MSEDGDDYGSDFDADLIEPAAHPTDLKRKRTEDGFGEDIHGREAKLVKDVIGNNLPNDALFDQALALLTDKFSYGAFRLKQELVIRRILHHESTLCVFPTGGGKSLCYQIPSQLLEGLTIVVCPLIALMEDQVSALKKAGFAAEFLNSVTTLDGIHDINDRIKSGMLKILYVSPERLTNQRFLAGLRGIKVSLVAVDESHCVSQWGHAFRPDYLKVPRFAKEIGAESVLCLTATAIPEVATDICTQFGIDADAGIIRTTSFRENLILQVESFETASQKKLRLVEYLQARPTGSKIIYATLAKDAETLQAFLRAKGLDVVLYHAHLKPEDKDAAQKKWLDSNKCIMIATIAFGMGIDKSDVRQIIHFNAPHSKEGYSQEIGRAGRDGKDSECLLMLCPEDEWQHQSFAISDTPSAKSVESLLREIFIGQGKSNGMKIGEQLMFMPSRLATAHDMPVGTVKLIFTYLELDYGMLRSTTPMYTRWRLRPLKKTIDFMKLDGRVGTEIYKFTKMNKTQAIFDMERLVRETDVSASEAALQLHRWEQAGQVECKPEQSMDIFILARTLSSTEISEEIQRMTEALVLRFEQKEETTLHKSKSVIELGTTRECIALQLARHFGDDASVPAGGCGKCTFCSQKTVCTYNRQHAQSTEIDNDKLQTIFETLGRDEDARFLARFAYGISSPRLTSLKIRKDASTGFGTMVEYDFYSLLDAFAKR